MPRLFEYDYKPGEEVTFRIHLSQARFTLPGGEAAQHVRSAFREALLAVRSGLDQVISRLDQPARASANRGAASRRRRLVVE